MNNFLNLRTVNSQYGDVTKGSVLSQADVDNNFLFLKGINISTATTVGTDLVLSKINGENINIDLSDFSGSSTSESYWISGSSGNYSVKTINDSSIDATGNYSHAQGNGTTASGQYSHAEGNSTESGGDSSHAEGMITYAGGEASHSEGNSTESGGEASHSEGYYTSASGDYSHAEGSSTLASGLASHAEGFNTVASGQTSHAEGNLSVAGGTDSHAEGQNSKAIGNTSHAEGQNSIASGTTSHAQNRGNIASGSYSHAGGDDSEARGITSFIHSTNSLVTGARSVVLGGENITGSTDDTVYVPNLNIETIGSGTSVTNLGVDSSGNVVSGTTGGGGGGNATVDNFYYQVSNSVDTRPVFTDGNVTIGWEETGNDLEFTMDVAPLGSGDMRSLSYKVGGSTENVYITTVSNIYDLHGAGVAAGDRLEAFITAENDETYPAYKITVYNTGESSLVSIWIERITKN